VQDQLAGLAGTATQLDPCAGREGLGGKAQAERQGLVAAAQVAAGQQALRATALIDHQQRQFDVGAGRHAFQGAAQFALVGGQGPRSAGCWFFSRPVAVSWRGPQVSGHRCCKRPAG